MQKLVALLEKIQEYTGLALGLLSVEKNEQKLIINRDFGKDISEPVELPEGIDPDLFMDYIIAKKRFGEGAIRSGETVATSAIRKEEPPMPVLKEGSVSKRKDGRWMGRYYENGSAKALYARTKLDCIVQVNAAVKNRDKNQKDPLVSGKMVLDSGFDTWLEIYKKNKLAESTRIIYRRTYKSYLQKQLGKKLINKLRPIDIRLVMNTITSLSRKAAAFTLLNECINDLMPDIGMKVNPCSYIETPVAPHPKEKPSYTDDEMALFLDRLKEGNEPLYRFAKFISLSGLRKGEALGLKWSDLDFDKKTISVSKQWNSVVNKITDPKSKSSFRTVPLYPDAEDTLSGMKRGDGYVFAGIGRVAVSKTFGDNARRLEMPGMTLHVLRHYFCTQCHENGVDGKVVQGFMGHSKLDLTMNLYTHVDKKFLESETKKMAKTRKK